MRKPDAYIPRSGINSKMGIKSSLGKLRSVVSLSLIPQHYSLTLFISA